MYDCTGSERRCSNADVDSHLCALSGIHAGRAALRPRCQAIMPWCFGGDWSRRGKLSGASDGSTPQLEAPEVDLAPAVGPMRNADRRCHTVEGCRLDRLIRQLFEINRSGG